MTRVLAKESILWAISEQRIGYKFGEPERVDPESLAVVLPILRDHSLARTYTTYPEIKSLHVKDSGSIETMLAKNAGEIPVFLRCGTIFKGATQERASVRSMIILPGESAKVTVRCVHASRGISRDAKTTYGGTTPLDFDQQVYTSGFSPRTQHDYWDTVKTVSASMSASLGGPLMKEETTSLRERIDRAGRRSSTSVRPRSSAIQARSGVTRHALFSTSLGRSYTNAFDTNELLGGPSAGMDDLSSNYSEFSKNFDEVLRKVKHAENQVGVALITVSGCETIEVFDARESWKALHEDAVKRLGPSLANRDKSSVFEYKPEKAMEVVRNVLALPFKENVIYEHKPNNGDPGFCVVGLSAGDYTGEVVELDGKVIHLVLLRMSKN